LDDLPAILRKEYPLLATSDEVASELVAGIRSQVFALTAELFAAFENEYSIFCPMTNCFEVFGLDFLVDSDCKQVCVKDLNLIMKRYYLHCFEWLGLFAGGEPWSRLQADGKSPSSSDC